MKILTGQQAIPKRLRPDRRKETWTSKVIPAASREWKAINWRDETRSKKGLHAQSALRTAAKRKGIDIQTCVEGRLLKFRLRPLAASEEKKAEPNRAPEPEGNGRYEGFHPWTGLSI